MLTEVIIKNKKNKNLYCITCLLNGNDCITRNSFKSHSLLNALYDAPKENDRSRYHKILCSFSLEFNWIAYRSCWEIIIIICLNYHLLEMKQLVS